MAKDVEKTQKILKVGESEAGGVVVEGGRNVWQWKDEQLDSTSIVLKRLENDDLQLEPTRKVKKIAAKDVQRKGPDKGEASGRNNARGPADSRGKPGRPSQADPGVSLSTEIDYNADNAGGGFDPYNRS